MDQRQLSGVGRIPQDGVACNTTSGVSVPLKGLLKDKGIELSENPIEARRQIAEAIQVHNILMSQMVRDCDQAVNNPYVHLALRVAKQPTNASILLWRTKCAASAKLELPPRCTLELFSSERRSTLVRAFLSSTTPGSFEMMKPWEPARLMASCRARELARMIALYESICTQQKLYYNEPLPIRSAQKARELCTHYGLPKVQVFSVDKLTR